jgi:hypothetical protein
VWRSACSGLSEPRPPGSERVGPDSLPPCPQRTRSWAAQSRTMPIHQVGYQLHYSRRLGRPEPSSLVRAPPSYSSVPASSSPSEPLAVTHGHGRLSSQRHAAATVPPSSRREPSPRTSGCPTISSDIRFDRVHTPSGRASTWMLLVYNSPPAPTIGRPSMTAPACDRGGARATYGRESVRPGHTRGPHAPAGTGENRPPAPGCTRLSIARPSRRRYVSLGYAAIRDTS